MKRISIIAFILVSLLVLSSCTSTRRKPTPVQIQIQSIEETTLFSLDIPKRVLEEAGYAYGDWLLLELDGIAFRAIYNDVVLNSSITLIGGQNQSTLYMPKAIKEGSTGILFLSGPPERQSSSSVSFTGNFVFTL